MRTVPVEARLTEFKTVSEEEVAKIIMNMKTKQCELDTILQGSVGGVGVSGSIGGWQECRCLGASRGIDGIRGIGGS